LDHSTYVLLDHLIGQLPQVVAAIAAVINAVAALIAARRYSETNQPPLPSPAPVRNDVPSSEDRPSATKS
jgi:hypothetical protein